jgi:hypothetical protein
MINRLNTRSQVLNDFFPIEYINIVNCFPISIVPPENTKKEDFNKELTESAQEEEQIAIAIIQNTPVGMFKSGDCKKIIKQNFPIHNLNKIDSAAYGTLFLKTIWPILEKYGVKSEKSNRGPRKYEMTHDAKNKAG